MIDTPDVPDLVTNGAFLNAQNGWHGDAVSTVVVPATAGARGAGNALRILVRVTPESYPWTHTVRQALTAAAIRTGDTLYFRAFLRSSERLSVGVNIESTKTSEKQLSRTVRLTPEWQEFRLVTKATHDFAPGEATLVFHCGTGNGSLEMTDIHVENYGATPAVSLREAAGAIYTRPRNDAWRSDAEARIAQIRKGDASFAVVDRTGKPVPGAAIRTEQARHHFRWGTAIDCAYILNNGSDDQRLRAELKRLFNTVVFGIELKWHWQDHDPKRLDKALAAARWLRANGFDMRGHTLMWGSFQFSPDVLRDKSPAEMRRLIEAHIGQDMTAMRGQLYLWDVVNEAVTERDVWEKVGWDMFPRCFFRAREIEPRVQRCYRTNLKSPSISIIA